MKRFIITAVAVLFACVSLNAQTANLTSKGATVFQDGVKISSEQVMSLLPSPYDEQYARARKMNIGGNVSLIAGGVVAAGGALLTIEGNKIMNSGKDTSTAVAGIFGGAAVMGAGITACCIGAGAIITGAILKGCASSKVKNAISVGNNGGIALNF